MHNLKAIIFDMDGTIADTEEIHRQAFNAAFAEYKLPCHWDQMLYKKLLSISGGRQRIKQYLLENKLVPENTESVSKFAARVHKTKSEIYRQKLVDGQVGLRPGIMRLMTEARVNNITMAIATSSSINNVETLLTTNLGKEAISLFKSIVSCETIEQQKPAPAVYQQVLKQLKLNANNCIALEDTLNGNKSALAAGIATVITTHMFTMDETFEGASLVINHLGESDMPMIVKSGDANGARFVDIALLERLLDKNNEQAHYTKSRAVAGE